MRAVKRPVVLITIVAALVAATVQAWSDVRQARAYRRLIAAGGAVGLDRECAEARELLGMEALAQGRADEASAELNRALKLQPALDATRWTLVDLYAMQGRTRDEATQREALAALDASRPEGLGSLALTQ